VTLLFLDDFDVLATTGSGFSICAIGKLATFKL